MVEETLDGEMRAVTEPVDAVEAEENGAGQAGGAILSDAPEAVFHDHIEQDVKGPDVAVDPPNIQSFFDASEPNQGLLRRLFWDPLRRVVRAVVNIVTVVVLRPQIIAQHYSDLAVLSMWGHILRHKRIPQAMMWRDSEQDSYRDFSQWSKQELKVFHDFYREISRYRYPDRRVDLSTTFGRSGLLSGSSAVGATKAGGLRDVYMAHAALSVWIDVNRHASWRLIDYSDTQLRQLLGVDSLVLTFGKKAGSQPAWINYRHAMVLPDSPLFVYDFLNAITVYPSRSNVASVARKAAINRLLWWMCRNMYHGPTSKLLKMKNRPFATMKESLTMRHHELDPDKENDKGFWSMYGCHSLIHMLIYCLRAMNIPADYVQTGGHGSLHVQIANGESIVLVDGDFPWNQEIADPFFEMDLYRLFMKQSDYQREFPTKEKQKNQHRIGLHTQKITSQFPTLFYLMNLWTDDKEQAKWNWHHGNSYTDPNMKKESERQFEAAYDLVQKIRNKQITNVWAKVHAVEQLDYNKIYALWKKRMDLDAKAWR